MLAVNVDGSTIEINADTLRVKTAGITANELGANSVGSSELANDAVDTNAIQDGVITPDKLTFDPATQTELDDHINDATAAHTGTAIANTPAGGIAANTVQGAINELDSEKAAVASAVMDGDAAGGVLSGTYPNPGFAADMATQVELDAHINDTLDAHDASAISSVPAGGLVATDLQAAVNELDTEKQPLDADLTAIAALADPNADRILFWDDSLGAYTFLTPGTNLSITGTTLDASGGGSGELLERDIAQSGHGLAVGDVVRLSGANYVKAQANSEVNAEVVGIVSAVAGANDFTLHYGGRITGLSGLTAGVVYFLDDDTAGLLTATPPGDAGDVSKPVLLADTTTTGYFYNFRGIVLVDEGSSGGAAAVQYESRSSNTILGVADNGKVIDITAAITQTFEADETLGDGWSVTLRNATDEGTVVVTLNPDGSETIDGLTTVTMYAGETRQIICNGAGANFNSVMLQGGWHRYTADGNFVVPHGITEVEVDAIGGGGGGGGNTASGGGGGGRIKRSLPASALGNPGDSVAVDVGAGGTGGASGGTHGTAGGNTTLGTTLVVAGGGGRGGPNTHFRGGGGGGDNEAGQDAGGVGDDIRGGAAFTSGNQPGYGESGGGCGSTGIGQAAHWGGGSGSGRSLTGGGHSINGGGGGGGDSVPGGGTGPFTGGLFAATGGAVATNGADGDLIFCGEGGGGGGPAGNGGVPGGGGGGGGGATAGGTGGRGELRIWYR